MTYVVKILEDRSGDWPAAAGTYYQEFDPEVATPRGEGRLFVTTERVLARHFETQAEAASLWDRFPALKCLTLAIYPAEETETDLEVAEVITELLTRALRRGGDDAAPR